MKIVYVSIGNSDDKLTQHNWSNFVMVVREELRRSAAAIHGEWYSASDAAFQNACFCVQLPDGIERTEHLKMKLGHWAETYKQDSIAWAEAPVTEFIPGVTP